MTDNLHDKRSILNQKFKKHGTLNTREFQKFIETPVRDKNSSGDGRVRSYIMNQVRDNYDVDSIDPSSRFRDNQKSTGTRLLDASDIQPNNLNVAALEEEQQLLFQQMKKRQEEQLGLNQSESPSSSSEEEFRPFPYDLEEITGRENDDGVIVVNLFNMRAANIPPPQKRRSEEVSMKIQDIQSTRGIKKYDSFETENLENAIQENVEIEKASRQMKPNLLIVGPQIEIRPKSNSKTRKLEMPVVKKETDHQKYASDLRKGVIGIESNALPEEYSDQEELKFVQQNKTTVVNQKVISGLSHQNFFLEDQEPKEGLTAQFSLENLDIPTQKNLENIQLEQKELLERMNQGNNKMGSYSGSSEISENEEEDFSPNQQAETLKKLNFLED